MGKVIGFIFGLLLISSVAWAGAVTQTIASAPPAAGTWTGAIAPLGKTGNGFLNVSVYGATWAGTVTLQRSFDSGVTWYDITTFTSNAQKALIDKEGGVRYRIGIKNTGLTSGSVAVRLSR